MKLLIKILLFVFVALIANVRVTSATITFPNIQETTTSLSFHTKIVEKAVFKISENDLANSCKNGQDLVAQTEYNLSSYLSFKKRRYKIVGAELELYKE